MAKYHLYFIRDGLLIGSDDIEAADDDQAAGIARAHCDGRVVEVWNDHRRVRIVMPAGATLEQVPY